ncbi:hypothetical protein [Bradyrhizobium diazoefficiens]|nr:hypothetical protein XF15B_58980 [Bradyrhizobium diazoefficiens]
MHGDNSAIARQTQIAMELRDVEFEIYQLRRQRKDRLAALEMAISAGRPAHEIEEMKKLIGQDDLGEKLALDRQRYLDRALKEATENAEVELKFKRSLGGRKPKPKL